MDALMKSRNHVLALAAGLCLAVLVGGWFLLISPKRAQVNEIRGQVSAQESTNNSLRSQVAALRALQAKLPQQQAALASMQSKVPDKPDLPALVRLLSKAATDSGVTLMGVAPTAPAPLTNASGVSGIDVTLKVSGDYVSLEQYHLALEGLSRAFLVNGMTIAASTDASSSGSSAGGPSALSATINGRVLMQTTPTPTTGAKPTTTG